MTLASGFLPTPIRMTLNDLEYPIQLKVRFAYTARLTNVYVVAFGADHGDCVMNIGLNCQPQRNVANEL